jgi:hypothetical protein
MTIDGQGNDTGGIGGATDWVESSADNWLDFGYLYEYIFKGKMGHIA